MTTEGHSSDSKPNCLLGNPWFAFVAGLEGQRTARVLDGQVPPLCGLGTAYLGGGGELAHSGPIVMMKIHSEGKGLGCSGETTASN